MSGNLFAIIAYDRPGSDTLRVQHREEHLAHFKKHTHRIAVAGPISGNTSGSLVILRAQSEKEARAFIEGDPFYPAGVWDRIEVTHFKAASGEWAS